MSNPTIETIKKRRSIRVYADKQISNDELEKIITAGRVAPSGRNVQMNHFIVIQNEKKRKAIRRLIEDAYAAIDPADPTYPKLERAILRAKKHDYDFFFSAPTLIVVANKRHNENGMADVAVALENMMLAATSLSIGSCYINQFKRMRDNPEVMSFFGDLSLADDEHILGALSLGYAGSAWPTRKEITGNLVTYHR